MDAKTLKALKASIAKWEKHSVAETPGEVRIGVKYCALCKLFNDYESSCDGCPVKANTGRGYCMGTPYVQAAAERHNWADGFGLQERFQAAARAEVEFLKSLLPAEEQAP